MALRGETKTSEENIVPVKYSKNLPFAQKLLIGLQDLFSFGDGYGRSKTATADAETN
jgi:hypothetical protein